jgi:putative ABC transport system ATP-binding protein
MSSRFGRAWYGFRVDEALFDVTGLCVDLPSAPRSEKDRALPTRIVDGVSFRLGRGEALVLVGPSGSGKSTLLRTLNRLVEPTVGTVHFGGRDICSMDPRDLRRRVALVMQTPVMFEGTVEENLRTRPNGSLGSLDKRRLGKALEDVGLEASVLDRDAASLSGGEKQRVAIARALLGDPEVFLLDEPTSALDPPNAAMVVEAVARLRSERKLSIIAVTHQPELVRRIGGRLLYLVKGRIRADEPIQGGAAFTSATLEAFLRGEHAPTSEHPESA